MVGNSHLNNSSLTDLVLLKVSLQALWFYDAKERRYRRTMLRAIVELSHQNPVHSASERAKAWRGLSHD
jgi:hypothetical protein